MNLSRKRCVAGLCVVVAVVFCAGAALADWPQFLGPDRNCVAAEAKGLPRSWPAGGPKVVWKIPVGAGFAGVAIYGDSALLLDRDSDKGDILRRLSLKDGKEVWHYAYDAPGKVDHPGSRSTPATDGKLIFTIGTFGDIKAVKFADGSLVWQGNLLKDWGGQMPGWGVAQSPLLMGEAVVVAPWGKKAAIAALNKTDGKPIWQTPNSKDIGMDYSSPVPMTLGGRMMIVAAGQHAKTIGVEAKTGRMLWSFEGYNCKIHVPSPTILSEGRVLLTGGYDAGGAMFQVGRTSEGYTTRQVWKSKAMASKIPQAVVYKGFIYGNSSDNGAGLRCITPEGQVKWETRDKVGFDMGNLLIADDLIFIVEGSSGQLVMAEASPAGYKELGRAQVLSGQDVWGPLAYSGGKLLLRDQGSLACVDLMAK